VKFRIFLQKINIHPLSKQKWGWSETSPIKANDWRRYYEK